MLIVFIERQRPKDGILQKVDDSLVEVDVCNKAFGHFNETQQVCAAGDLHVGGKAVCNGDSGGPLQCKTDDGRWHEVGIVSYGYPCALKDKPDVFTKVSAFYDWIVTTISNNQ